jgi:hypothetical protein
MERTPFPFSHPRPPPSRGSPPFLAAVRAHPGPPSGGQDRKGVASAPGRTPAPGPARAPRRAFSHPNHQE